MNKNDFPILKGIHYLDNAATTQKPNTVIESITEFYKAANANTHRGLYKLAEKATEEHENARITLAKFVNALPEEIIFTRNATESFNILARSLESKIKPGNKLISTEVEHHANFIPWQQLAKRKGAEFIVAKYNPKTHMLESISDLVDEKTKIIAFTQMSNVSGLIIDVKKEISEIRKKNSDAIIIIDAAQSIPHMKIDVKDLDADFLCFSTHKLYGPTGVGVIYGKKELLEKMEPSVFGGHMIDTVRIKDSTWGKIPDKFEAGTANSAGIVASAKAVEYLEKNNLSELFKKEEELKKYLVKKLIEEDVEIIGHNSEHYGPVVSFTIKGVHPHDIATIADKYNVCLRAGHHCAQPFMAKLGITDTARASISFYNEKEDVDALIESIKYAKKILR